MLYPLSYEGLEQLLATLPKPAPSSVGPRTEWTDEPTQPAAVAPVVLCGSEGTRFDTRC